MKNLTMKSLNIISDQDATIDSNEFGTFKILFNKEEKEENQSLETASAAPGSSSISSLTARTAHLSIRPILSTPAIEMAKNLHELLLHINNLPTIPPTMNPLNIDVKLYIQKLLEKLSTLTKDEFEAEIDQTNEDFLIIYNLKNKQDQGKEEEEQKEKKEVIDFQSEKKEVIDFQSELNFPEIIPEIDLLKLDDDFDIIKENTIKTLVT